MTARGGGNVQRTQGAGRGRGAVTPAWMTSTTQPPSAPGSDKPSSNTINSSSAKKQEAQQSNPITNNAETSNLLPAGWEEAFDETYKHPYWYNASTGERTWTKPESKLPPLPPGWSQADDPTTGQAYYYNQAANITQWERPTIETIAASIATQHSRDPLDSLFSAAPVFAGSRPGWVFKMGPKGVGYYVDSPDTGRLLGEKPLELGEDHGPTSVKQLQLERNRERLRQREEQLKRQQQQKIQQKRPFPSTGGGRGDGGRGKGAKRDQREVDPMDPSAYSDAPAGGWGSGLGKD